MNKNKRRFYSNIALVVLGAILYIGFTLTNGQERWVQMLMAAMVCGTYGVVDVIIKKRFKD